ncbi:CooT family nickel-binding protein [Candidatus Bipolaricaulota bacterium]|nr:CooT family nickel-binding protein [Candidatus Bipolaricaulota bacterium]
MCLSKAYADNEKTDEALLEDIASVEVRDGKLLFTTILGATEEIQGSIKKIDFSKNEIYLKKDEGE